MTDTELLTTFFIGEEMYGIEVIKVQEVTGRPVMVPVPLAPRFVRGLINLRGQLATAIGLRELLNKPKCESNDEMSVVCRSEGNLVSLIVDQIGDVVEMPLKDFETVPETISLDLRKYLKVVYKMNNQLLAVLDLEKITKELSPSSSTEGPEVRM